MYYKIVNLNANTARDMMLFFGDDIITSLYYQDADCVTVGIDPDITILKINGGNLTIDVGAKLFTIPYEDYAEIRLT